VHALLGGSFGVDKLNGRASSSGFSKQTAITECAVQNLPPQPRVQSGRALKSASPISSVIGKELPIVAATSAERARITPTGSS
jgi:hypothetical protein